MLGRGIGFAVIFGITGTLGFESLLPGDFEVFGDGLGLIKSIAFVPPINDGYEKFLIGSFARALRAKVFQIRAGKEPPVTEFKPPIPDNSSVASSRKSATDADN
jgi:hypothetical protein